MVTDPDPLIIIFNDYRTMEGVALNNLNGTSFTKSHVVESVSSGLIKTAKRIEYVFMIVHVITLMINLIFQKYIKTTYSQLYYTLLETLKKYLFVEFHY